MPGETCPGSAHDNNVHTSMYIFIDEFYVLVL